MFFRGLKRKEPASSPEGLKFYNNKFERKVNGKTRKTKRIEEDVSPLTPLQLLLQQTQSQQSLHRGFSEQPQRQLLARVPVVPHVSGHHHTNKMASMACPTQQQLQLRMRQHGKVNGCRGRGSV